MIGAVAGVTLGGTLKPDIAAHVAEWKQDVRDLREYIMSKGATQIGKNNARDAIEKLDDQIKKAIADPQNFIDTSPIKPQTATPGLINPISPQFSDPGLTTEGGGAVYEKPKSGLSTWVDTYNKPSTGPGKQTFTLAQLNTALSTFQSSDASSDRDKKQPLALPQAPGVPWWLWVGIAFAVVQAAK